MNFINLPRLAVVAFAAAMGTQPALAQDTTTGAPTAGTDSAAGEQAATPEGTADTAPAGETAQQDAQPQQDGMGKPYVAEVTGDWQIECLRTPLDADPCRMVQILLDKNNPAVRVEMVALPDGGPAPAVGSFYTPLETLLSEQLTLSVDGGPQSRHTFNYCTPQYCVSQVRFGEDAIAAFKGGNKAQAVIVPLRAPDQQVELTMSLTGFTAAYDRLSELSRANFEAARKAAEERAQQGN